ncbi:MAG: hypothetical protein Q4A83_01025 [Bacillota bacterium]|nr:hypothetical protein [Bacillota bacterium]
MNITFPTSSDIYLEADGKKIAAVQSYRAVSDKTEKLIEAFGSSRPVAVLTTGLYHRLELTRLYATDEAISDGIDFHTLDDFSVVIVKPDRRIVYTGCRWSGIEENGRLGETVAEKVRVLAAKRLEMEA